jgi:cobalamin biosynthesis protein CobT
MIKTVTKGIILGKTIRTQIATSQCRPTLKTTRLQAGKIDRRLISQLGYDNANVFHRIVTDRFKNYFIHISIDASGSMAGEKFRNAITVGSSNCTSCFNDNRDTRTNFIARYT